MDIVTQGLLGATVAYAVGSKKIAPRKTLGYGAFFGILPDFDIFFKYFSSNPLATLFYHRGITHSLFAAPVIALIVAFIVYKKQKECVKTWFWLSFWAILTHPLLDLFTTYGTQLLQPFSNHRFSLNAISIVDPVYSVPLLISILIALFAKNDVFARIFNAGVLFLTTAYLFLGVAQYEKARERVLEEAQQNGWCGHFEVFTGLFSIFERRAVFYEKDHVHIAHFSNLTKDKICWVTFKQEELDIHSKDIQTFKWFSKGHILVKKDAHGYMLRDIRFGIDPHPIDGLWGSETDLHGHYKNWADFASMKIESFKKAIDQFSNFSNQSTK